MDSGSPLIIMCVTFPAKCHLLTHLRKLSSIPQGSLRVALYNGAKPATVGNTLSNRSKTQLKRTTNVLYATLGTVIVVGTGLLVAHAQQKAAVMPEPKCKVTPVEAIKIAKGKVPGRPLNANFEFDEGKWVYGVMIVSGSTIKEVEIDPMTGKVGDVEAVTPAGEAAEMRDELTKAIGGKVSANPAEEKEEKDEKP